MYYVKNPRNNFTFLVLLLLIFDFSFSQDNWKKVSYVQNFNVSEIGQAAPKTYDITQNENGILYFANEYGLLQYTGVEWRILLQPENRSHISSLLNHNSRTFIGSNNEIGFAEKNVFNQIYYTSLRNQLPKGCDDFTNVWATYEIENKIYFCTDHLFIIYDPETESLNCIPHTNRIEHVSKFNGIIYFLDEFNNISKIKDEKIQTLFYATDLPDFNIKQIAPYDNKSLLIHTEHNGFYLLKNNEIQPWAQENSDILNKINISAISLINNETYCIGTTNNGIYFINKSGKILENLNRDNKLLSNTIIDVFVDRSSNLWVTLDGSISYIELTSPFYTLGEQDGIFGSTYDIEIYDNELFVATSNGIYYKDWTKGSFNQKFNKVNGVEGQVWDISIIKEKLLIGTHQGSYILSKDKTSGVKTLKKISSIEGGWNFVKVPDNENLLLQGTYNGLIVYELKNDSIQLKHKIKGFHETSREVQIDNENNIWVSHGYKGIYKLKADKEYTQITKTTLYNKEQGLPGDIFNSILDTKQDDIFIGTQLGVYQYAKEKDSIILSSKFTEALTNHNLVRKLSKINDNTYIFIQGYDREDDIGLLKFELDGDFSIQRIPFQSLQGKLIPAFEKFIKLNDQEIGFTSKEGIIIYNNLFDSNKSKDFETIITKVQIKDSIIYGNVPNYVTDIRKDSIQKPIAFRYNQLKFSFVSPFYQQPVPVEYQVYLEGFDDKWSDWKTNTFKEYNYLPDGNYNLRVRAKNIYDQVSTEASYKFTILPPWYRTIPMYFVYIAILAIIIYLVIQIKNEQRKKSEEKLKLVHQKEIELQQVKFEEQRLKQKNEKIKDDNQKLKQHIENSNKELAASAMQMVQVDNSILQMKDVLSEIIKQTEGEQRKKLKSVLKTLNDQLNGEGNWKQFEIHFNQIHNNSLDKIKEKYPDLNHREIRLCAYLKLNLSSKEIAPLMGISYRGIESLRFRIRKKMNLDSSVNLTEYIVNFK